MGEEDRRQTVSSSQPCGLWISVPLWWSLPCTLHVLTFGKLAKFNALVTLQGDHAKKHGRNLFGKEGKRGGPVRLTIDALRFAPCSFPMQSR